MSVKTASSPLDRLKVLLAEIDDLRRVEHLLDWDQHVFMPRAGAAARAEAHGTVTQVAHELLVSDAVGELLAELEPFEDEFGPESVEGALLRVARRDRERARRVPAELIGELRRTGGVAVAAWERAKAESDFGLFAPHLERQLELKREYAACFPEAETPYDALLEDYEEGMTTARVAEVTYGLHIIIRFELDQALLCGDVAVRDVPEAWNARMQQDLGVHVPDDAHGALQDIHWGVGLFGYFPTYQLGNVMSVQIWRHAEAQLGDLEAQFARGEFTPLREWLREHVYRFGRRYPPRELLERVTGSALDPAPYLDYLRTKFSQ